MGRIIFAIVLFFVIVFGAAYYIATGAPAILSAFLSHRIHAEVKVKRLDFKKDAICIRNFIIKNPKKAILPDALKIQHTKITAPYKHYFKNPIEIDEILLEDVYLSILLKKGSKVPCNWHHIFETMEESSGPSIGPKRSFEIKTLAIKDLRVEVAIAGSKPKTVTVDKLAFHNIKSDEGLPIEELSHVITQKLVSEIFSLGMVKKVAEGFLEAPIDAFKFIFGGGGSKSKNENPCHEESESKHDRKLETQNESSGDRP